MKKLILASLLFFGITGAVCAQSNTEQSSKANMIDTSKHKTHHKHHTTHKTSTTSHQAKGYRTHHKNMNGASMNNSFCSFFFIIDLLFPGCIEHGWSGL